LSTFLALTRAPCYGRAKRVSLIYQGRVPWKLVSFGEVC